MTAAAVDLEQSIATLADRFDEREPTVSAFLPEPGRFDRLRREARELVDRYPDESYPDEIHPDESRPALFGLLLGVKDVFRVDGFPTRAGSRLPAALFAGTEASSVTALRAAGALVVGKTVSTEFAYFAPGPTSNPRDPERTPGGSSSGSAAAVGAGLCDAALGTQTIGSIARPASYCGVVGFKPSFDRVATDGVVPLAPSLDHVGCFAAGLATARRVAAVWLGAEAATAPTAARRARLAVPIGPYLERADEEGRAHFAAVVAALVAGGWDVVDVPAMADFSAVESRHRRIVAVEAAAVHAAWYPEHRDAYAPQTAELIARGAAVAPEQYRQDLAGRAALRGELADLLDRRACDLWVSPAARGAAPLGLASTGDPVMNLPWTHAGMPVVVLPSGRGELSRMPIGLQIAGRFGADAALLAEAAAIERLLATPRVGSA